MKTILNTIKSMFTMPKRETLEEIYLGQATNLVELERRMKEIERGQAPWQDRDRGGY